MRPLRVGDRAGLTVITTDVWHLEGLVEEGGPCVAVYGGEGTVEFFTHRHGDGGDS